MDTKFILMAKYDGNPILDLDVVRKDFFSELGLQTFINKVESGEIPLPFFRMNPTQKGKRKVSLVDLAGYIEKCNNHAKKELCRK